MDEMEGGGQCLQNSERWLQDSCADPGRGILWLGLNSVFVGTERHETSKDRLCFLVKNLEIREAKVHREMNSLTFRIL